MFFGLAILCLATVPVAPSKMIHEKMSVDQVAEVFQTTHNLVPDYEVVQFHVPRLSKRDSNTPELLTTNAFGDDIQLWLNPAEGVLAGESTPVFTARTDLNEAEVIYEEIPDAMKNVGKLLEDPLTKASLVVKKDSRGQYSMNGFIGSKNLVVRSLPESISYDFMHNGSSYDSEPSLNSRSTLSTYHVIFKREDRDSDGIDKKIRLAAQRSRFFPSFFEPRAYPAIPKVVYPEIMVVVDYDLFALTGKSTEKVLMYTLAFWNGVDLLYRSLDEPKFRLNIARVIIAEDREATPYFSESMFDDKLIDAYKAHEAAQMYFFSILKIFPANSYDAIMAMTGRKMTSGNGNADTLGIALTGGACYVDHYRKSVWSMGITSDDGAFHGVATAAHEFGHLLGSSHDEKNQCNPTDGYIMAPSSGVTKNSHDFSECSVKDIGQFLKGNKGHCFYNEPKVTNPLPREFLPGILGDRDHQCKIRFGGKHCYSDTASQLSCTAIYCRDPNNSRRCYRDSSQAPPDGAFCGQGKVCLHGQCIKLQLV